jgi:hypothetical protein
LYALPIVVLILAWFYYWFAIADRYFIFLYNHDMGPLVPDTTPFSRVTASRYWMSGLVASGGVLVLYAAINWTLGRLLARYRPPAWWRVWAVCAAVLGLCIPAITMSVNEPTLPLRHAIQVTVATWVGTGLALVPGERAARRPGDLLWLTADGFGLMMFLLNLVHVEKLSHWLARGATLWVWMMAGSLAVGATWLLFLTALRWFLRQHSPGAGALFTAGVCVAYLLMPLVHHGLGTDGYFYITDSDNFFAQRWTIQLATWLATGSLALGLTWIRTRIGTRRTSSAGQRE